ncbi:MAG TPA: sorbitol-6-phosphate dehydrogenase [Clostridiaceae bacterium]|jgi:sorbitol-6-phosphate 2-dehydrogenase|nr:sorbitol-6-phosphate dehydrogenase [Clostridiaceae bacterium]
MLCDKIRRLEGQVAIVTGSAQGLGEALAVRLNKEGCKVIVADINIEKAEKVAAKLTDSIAVKVDVSDEEQVENMVKSAVDKYGKLDLLVSNAAILIAKQVTDFSAKEWKKMMDINLVGYFICAKAAAKVMIPNKKGNIIQINSKSGKKGSYKNSAYAASKFGGIGLTQSLGLELAEYNIRVNAICPGNLLDSPLWVDSLYEQYAKNQGITVEEVRKKYLGQVPLGRGCSYDDVANVMVFLASDEASYMTGQAINVTGGQEMR